MYQSTKLLLVSLLSSVLLIGCSNKNLQTVEQSSLNNQQGRVEISLNAHWQFHKGTLPGSLERAGQGDTDSATNEQVWSDISLPHTWNIEDGANGGNDYFRGDGWYRKQLKISKDLVGKRFYLHFDGANLVTDVYIDGNHVGQHRGGYSAFRFDLTDHLELGVEHQLAIKVNNAEHRDVAPLSADFTFFGGIYRDLLLLVTDQDHIELMNYASPGVFISQESLSDSRAKVKVQVNLANKASDDINRTLQVEVMDHKGVILQSQSQPVLIPQQGKVSESLPITIENPTRWNGVKQPYLYSVVTTLLDGDRIVDRIKQPLGLREFMVDPDKGLLLNGEYYDMRGVSRHQDMEGKGWALNNSDHLRDFEIIEEMGTTAVRLAHYPHDPYVFDLMDEMGFVTWAEIPLVNEVPEDKAFEKNATAQLKELIRQNYNHPSILFWGISNEVSMTGLTPKGEDVLKRLNTVAKQEDNSRLTTAAVLGHKENDEVFLIADIIAQNLYYGWYYGQVDGLGDWGDKIHSDFSDRAIGVSEYGAGAGISIHSDSPKKGDHSEEYQSLFHEGSWNAMKTRPFIWSKFIWNSFDFAADARDEGERAGMNDKGLVTYDRQTYKDSFYWYKANWSEEPVLHLTSKRFTERKREKVDVKIYSNLESAELFVNGVSLGKKQPLAEKLSVWKQVELKMGDNTLKLVGVNAAGKKMTEQATWTRIENDDTRIAAVDKVIGVDLANHRIYHLPYGTRVEQLHTLIELPYGATLDVSATGDAQQILTLGDEFKVIAGNGSEQVYSVARGNLSVARDIKVDRELAHGMMGYPAAPARQVVDSNSDMSLSIDEMKDHEVASFWLTGDPGSQAAQLRIDLGADYYIDRLVASWLPKAITEGGAIKYTIDLARDIKLDETVFVETYDVVIDRSNNIEPYRTEDAIQKVGRYLRVNTLESSYKVEIPLIGELVVVGATEFSVEGGLLYSTSVDINYADHSITVPAGVSVAELTAQLQTVSADYALNAQLDGKTLTGDEALTPDHYISVASKQQDNMRKERYAIVLDNALSKN